MAKISRSFKRIKNAGILERLPQPFPAKVDRVIEYAEKGLDIVRTAFYNALRPLTDNLENI